MRVAINVIQFQLGWFACVLAAANDRAWVGALVALTLASIHIARAAAPRRELWLCLAAAALGLVLDSGMTLAGLVSYRSEFPPWAPPWLVAMWVLFATTLNVSMRWLRGRPVLALLLGAVAGPLAYLGGARLGAMELLRQRPALIVLAVGWAVALPLLTSIAARLDVASDEPSSRRAADSGLR